VREQDTHWQASARPGVMDAGGHCGYCRLSEEITGTPLGDRAYRARGARRAHAPDKSLGCLPVLQSTQE